MIQFTKIVFGLSHSHEGNKQEAFEENYCFVVKRVFFWYGNENKKSSICASR